MSDVARFPHEFTSVLRVHSSKLIKSIEEFVKSVSSSLDHLATLPPLWKCYMILLSTNKIQGVEFIQATPYNCPRMGGFFFLII